MADAFWDFDAAHPVVSNIVALSDLRKVPNPRVELARATYISRLRGLYSQLCKSELGLREAPSSSFDRWLLGQLIVAKDKCSTSDPLLKRPETAFETDVLRRELLNALPASTYLRWSERDNYGRIAAVLRIYISKAREWAKRLSVDGCESVVSSAEEHLTRVEGDAPAAKQVMDDCAAACRPLFANALQEVLLGMLQKLVAAGRDCAQRIADLAQTSSDEQHEICVSVQDDRALVQYGGDTQTVKKLHFEKLSRLFEKHNAGASEHDKHICLYTLLRRYATMFGDDVFESAAMHAALPAAAFRVLQRELGVCHENFASPLNCFFAHFNSAFPDIDSWFGSNGSYADYTPSEGSFETGPPYTEEVMEQTALHIDELLAASVRPLSFVVFVPDWRTPLTPGQRIMEASPYLRGDFVCKGKQHSYVVGHQHIIETDNQVNSKRSQERYFVLPFDTHVYLLQNAAGAAKWPGGGAMERLHTAMRERPPPQQQTPRSHPRDFERDRDDRRAVFNERPSSRHRPEETRRHEHYDRREREPRDRDSYRDRDDHRDRDRDRDREREKRY